MTIIKVRVDTFKYGFTAYYSSVKKASELITKHPEFNKALQFMISSGDPRETGPNRKAWPSWDFDGLLADVFVTSPSEDELCFFIRGEHLCFTEYENLPEIKKLGEPYRPASSTKIREWREEYRPCIHRAEVYKIEVDEVTNGQT